MNEYVPLDSEIDLLFNRLNHEAEDSGYHLNPDVELSKGLIEGLLVNEKRYGYWACPCRLADGDKQLDLDIICPCDYRDADLNEFDTCYCKLYVSLPVKKGTKQIHSIPERRPEVVPKNSFIQTHHNSSIIPGSVWRCRVCGYLCARETPPEVCPICKAQKERFEPFAFSTSYP